MRRPYSPSVRLRRLSGELRRAREQAGLSHTEAVKKLKWSAARFSRWENAEAKRIAPSDLDQVMTVYGIEDPAKREALHALARDAQQRGWWWTYRDVFGSQALPDFEAEASVIRTFETVLIPGLLQTPEYAAAVFRGAAYAPEEQINRQVEARLARREILHRIDHPPRLTAVIDEAALRRPIGGAQVMRGQLDYLVRIGQAHNVDIHVLPFSAGAHPGLTGPFTILDFTEPTDLPIAYTDNLASGAFHEQSEDVDRYVRTFGDIQSYAMTTPQTAQFIEAILRLESDPA